MSVAVWLSMLALGGAVGGSLAHEFRRRKRVQFSVLEAAAHKLNLEYESAGFMGMPSVEGVYAGVPVALRVSFDEEDDAGQVQLDQMHVTVQVIPRLTPPVGTLVRRLTASERMLPNLAEVMEHRPVVTRIDDVVVRAAKRDEARVKKIFERDAMQAWVREYFDDESQIQFMSGRLSVRGIPAKTVASITGAVKDVVRAAKAFERAMGWVPAAEAALELRAKPLVAFGYAQRSVPAAEHVDATRAAVAGPVQDGLVGKLIAGLVAEGTTDSQGTFTLDRNAAMNKLRSSRLERKEAYVLAILRSAALRGATRIEFECDGDDLWIRFDGEPFEAAELDQIYAAAFATGADRRVQSRRHLALALEGALALEPRLVEFQTPRATLRRTLEVEHEIVDGGVEPPATGAFHVRTKSSLQRALEKFGHERELVARHARFMSAEVFINGDHVHQGPTADDMLGMTRIEVQGPTAEIYGWVGFARDGDYVGGAYVGKYDVWVEELDMPRAPPRLRAIVMAHDFDTDISQTKVVRNERFEAVLASIEPMVPRAVMQLADEYTNRRYDARYPTEEAADLLRLLCMDRLTDRTVAAADEFEPKTVEYAVLTARVWPTISGGRCSLRQLQRQRQKMGVVLFADANIAALVHGGEHERVWYQIEPLFPGHVLDVSMLSAAQRRWLAAVFRDDLAGRTPELLDAIAQR